MKQKEYFEEEALLPSSLLDEVYLAPENIQTNQSHFDFSREGKIEISEKKFFDSNFLNENNSTSELKEETSDETNDSPKKKQELNLYNYLNYSKCLNDFSEPIKEDLNKDKEINWSQINLVLKNDNGSSKSNQHDKNIEVLGTKEISKVNEYSYVNFKEVIDNGYDGTLNNFTHNISNVNFINNKNNLNFDEIKNYDFHNLFNEQNSLIKRNNVFKTRLINININNAFINDINIINNINKNNNFSNNERLLFVSNKLPNYHNFSVENYLNSSEYTLNNSLKIHIPKDSNAKFEGQKIIQAQAENSDIKNNNFFKNQEQVILKDKKLKNQIINDKDFQDFKRFCEKIKTSLPDYICSKGGSRNIQKYINQFHPLKIKYLIKKLYLNFEKIICDKFGNYFFQKLYGISTKKYRKKILYCIKDFFVTVSKDEIGVHAIQRMIEEMKTEAEKNLVINFIKGKELEMSLNKEGTHIIQKIIQIFAENERQNLTAALCVPNNIEKLLEDLNGVYVIKRMISFIQDINNKRELIEALYTNIHLILKTSNGCYIIYYLLEQWGIDIGINFVNILISNIETFSENKYTTDLIYKILLICTKRYTFDEYHNDINISTIHSYNNELMILKTFKELLFDPNKLSKVYPNKYGKYLISKILSFFSLEEKNYFYSFIKSFKSGSFCFDNKIFSMYNDLLNYSYY